MNEPPPRPELCGSTRPSTACTATAASTAEPPFLSTFRPASTASGLAAATITWPLVETAGAGPETFGASDGTVEQAAARAARDTTARRFRDCTDITRIVGGGERHHNHPRVDNKRQGVLSVAT